MCLARSLDTQRSPILVPPATSEPTMRFSVLVALIAYATFAIVQLASATPVLSTKDMVVKRDNADIVSVLNKLKTSVASPISEISMFNLHLRRMYANPSLQTTLPKPRPPIQTISNLPSSRSFLLSILPHPTLPRSSLPRFASASRTTRLLSS